MCKFHILPDKVNSDDRGLTTRDHRMYGLQYIVCMKYKPNNMNMFQLNT